MALASRRDGASLAELCTQLRVPKTSLHRLLRTLESGGYLIHQADIYRLGPTSFHLASLIGKAASNNELPVSARPVLEWLAYESQETVMLAVLKATQGAIVYIDVVDSEAPVRFTVPVGDTRPLYSTASGKVVLAFLPPDAQSAYLDKADFTAFTSKTTGRDELRGLLARYRERGLARDDGGKVLGASGVASPIFDSTGKVVGSISVAAPTDRLNTSAAQLETLVLAAGERISRMIGYSGAYPPKS